LIILYFCHYFNKNQISKIKISIIPENSTWEIEFSGIINIFDKNLR